MQEEIQTLHTGLESWAKPAIYVAGLATAMATGISAGRFKASAYSDVPIGKAVATILILLAAIFTNGIALLAATLMAPQENNLPTALIMLSLGTLPQLLVVLITLKSPNHNHNPNPGD